MAEERFKNWKKPVIEDSLESTFMLTKQQEDTFKETQKSSKKVQIKDDVTEESVEHTSKPKHHRTMRKTKKNDLGYTPSDTFTSRKERMEIPEGVEVFMYSGQRLNYYEQQKEQLRKTISQDKGNFYTYSPEHLSLAFPVVNENEIAYNEKMMNQSKWKTPDGFQNVTRKSKQEYTLHPKKPPQDVLDDRLAGFVGHVVKRAVGVGGFIVHGGRQDLVPDRQCAGDDLGCAGRSDKVAHHALNRAHRHVVGATAEELTDGQ